MTGSSRLRIVSAVAPRASRPPRRRPDERQRAAIRQILRSCPGLAAGRNLALVYTGNRREEAAWLCAFARAAGVEVTLAAAACAAGAVEHAVAAADAGVIIVLADMALTLPGNAIQLPGMTGANAIDLWEPPEAIAEQASGVCDSLGQTLLVRTLGGAELTASVVGARAGHPFGRVDVDVRSAAGVFVADAAIDINRPPGPDVRLRDRQVTVSVADGRVTDVSCQDDLLGRLLTRAIMTHRADRARSVRLGIRRLPGGFDPVPGVANSCRKGVTLRLDVDPARAYNSASADLRIDLISTEERVRR